MMMFFVCVLFSCFHSLHCDRCTECCRWYFATCL